MTTLQNDTLIRALLRQPVSHTPVWLMRQAGRYLPEYRATRQRAGSFLALAKTPSLATEVTLQPLERFALDGAILFSDILTVPDAMGLELYFVEGEGPKFRHPVRDEAAVAALRARAEEIRLSELERAEGRLAKLDEGERNLVEAITAQIVNKILHLPTVRMKEAAAGPNGLLYADALQHLFGLDEDVRE